MDALVKLWRLEIYLDYKELSKLLTYMLGHVYEFTDIELNKIKKDVQISKEVYDAKKSWLHN
jgi:hypothetical protein